MTTDYIMIIKEVKPGTDLVRTKYGEGAARFIFNIKLSRSVMGSIKMG
jgi:hypothetical protein